MQLSQVEKPVLLNETWMEHIMLGTVEETRMQYIPKYSSLLSSDG